MLSVCKSLRRPLVLLYDIYQLHNSIANASAGRQKTRVNGECRLGLLTKLLKAWRAGVGQEAKSARSKTIMQKRKHIPVESYGSQE